MLLYRLLLLLKLSAVLAYAGGVMASFVASRRADQKRAVHAVASPALLVVWVSGYSLSRLLGVPLTEPWLAGGLLLSLVSLLALMVAVQREWRRGFGVAGAALLAVLALMVFRPTWRGP